MNLIFTIIIFSSLLAITIVSPDKALQSLINGSKNGLTLTITLFTIYSVWLSILKLIELTKLDKKIMRLTKPIINKLFKTNSEKAVNQIAINMTANFLGMGGVATKAGINAIKFLDNNYTQATDDMLMLFVINCTSIQLIPQTAISMRVAHLSSNPSDIILPTIINTTITTIIGILLVKIFTKSSKNKGLSVKNNK